MQNKGYPTDFIIQLKEKCDIVSTISKYVPLTKKGKNYWGCCPFHFEKTPSFAVNEVEQFYHCFGCGESGDVVRFIEKVESLDFMGAVKLLAKNAGMEVPEWTGDEEVLKKQKVKEQLYTICDQTMALYEANLKLPVAQKAREYLAKRGISEEIAALFHIGYCDGWTSSVDYFKKKNVSPAILKEAGITDCKDKGNGNKYYYDVNADRLMFPIINSYGNCIGFTGRVLGQSDFAKYKNTAQTAIFDKSRVVYNINNIKKLKQEKGLDYIVIVEGNVDVISMVKAGIENTVACMGTAITEYHAKELKRFCERVVLCLDGDGAGQKSMFRSVDILMDGGLDVRCVTLPDGLDPDDYINKYGKDKLQELIDAAIPALDYKLISLSKKYNLTNNYDKRKYLSEAFEIVRALGTNSEQEVYLKLLSKITNISVDSLRRDIGNVAKSIEVDTTEQKSLEKRENSIQKAIKFIIASFVHKKEYASFDDINNMYFKNPNHQKLFDYLKDCYEKDKPYTVSSLFDMFDIDENPDIKEIIDFNFAEFGEKEEQYFRQSLHVIYNMGLKIKQENLMQEYKQESDLDKRRSIAMQLQIITKELQNRKNGDNR